MIVALFEDEGYENFFPITYTRPVFECISGMSSFLQRAQRMYPESMTIFFTRDYLVPTFKRRVSNCVNEPDSIDDETLLVNGTLVVDENVKQIIEKKLRKNVLIMQRERMALARLSERLARKHGNELCRPLTRFTLRNIVRECKTLEASNLPLMTYPWDLISMNAELVRKDYAVLCKGECEGALDKRIALYGEETDVYVDEGSHIEAHVTLDARGGPIYVGKETTVHAGSRISGPTYIGNKTIIATGLIREGCSIGDVCRVGGELEESIIQGYSNKYHTGFIGHAFIGEWVNIGAATTNSDLKNTYGTVQVTTKGEKMDTDQAKIGCFIADHVKTSIGTQIYTGKKIGVASQVYGVIAEDVPSFTIWAKSLGKKPKELYLESVVKTQGRVMSRRGVKQTIEDIDLLKKLFEITAMERDEAGVSRGKFEL